MFWLTTPVLFPVSIAESKVRMREPKCFALDLVGSLGNLAIQCVSICNIPQVGQARGNDKIL